MHQTFNSSAVPFSRQHGRKSDFTEQLMKADFKIIDSVSSSKRHDATPDQKSVVSKMLAYSSNKHLAHRDEPIHRDESRPFLRDPSWRRNDVSPDLSGFKDRKSQMVSYPTTSYLLMLNPELFEFVCSQR